LKLTLDHHAHSRTVLASENTIPPNIAVLYVEARFRAWNANIVCGLVCRLSEAAGQASREPERVDT
jgi:hypothetical protein